MNQRCAWRSSVLSTIARGKAFTLIELLLVIAIIALLMAILVPTLRRVRIQSRAVVCRSHLRQWGALVATHTSANNGRFEPEKNDVNVDYWLLGGYEDAEGPGGHDAAKSIRCCPMATKPTNPNAEASQGFYGGTFLAWGRFPPDHFGLAPGLAPEDYYRLYGSYGWNAFVGLSIYQETTPEIKSSWWATSDVRGANNIPVVFDCAWTVSGMVDAGRGPPNCDAIPTSEMVDPVLRRSACINRHDGGINVMFLDWSVRKVGLKELWMLKWHRLYNTAGPWTKAGGVERSDWPQWMRGFKDY